MLTASLAWPRRAGLAEGVPGWDWVGFKVPPNPNWSEIEAWRRTGDPGDVDSESPVPSAKQRHELIATASSSEGTGESPSRLHMDSSALLLPSSQQDAQLLDTSTTPAAPFGSDPPMNTLIYSSYHMKQKKGNILISSWNLAIYGSLNLHSFPKGAKGGTWLLCAD